jgi:peroxiredoxin
MTRLLPRNPVPDLAVDLVGGGQFVLNRPAPANFTMLVVYRGLHCPICAGYLRELDRMIDAFAERGVTALALSTDDAARAGTAKESWKLERLPVGYGLGLDAAERWGLYVSAGRGKTSTGIEEPALFAEPGLFLVRPDGTLYFASVQTMPFARPAFADILKAVDFVLAKDYPARGEVPRAA